MQTYIQIILLFIILIGLSCREKPTEQAHGKLELTAEDIGVYDVMIRFRANVSHGPWALSLTRDDRNLFFRPQPIKYASFDTTYRFSGLRPNYTHIFKAYYWIGETVIDSSEPLYVSTIDTTSHNFKWQIHTLGDGIANHLNDVTIINDSCVMVVGEIYKIDSTGHLDGPYGLAKWNGKEWKIEKLNVLTPAGFYSIMTPDGIFGFSPTDVWIANGDIHHYNGDSVDRSYWLCDWIGNPDPMLPPGQSLKKIWGTASNNLYAVGAKGAIVHFDGDTWQIINSGINSYIYDVYGSTNSKTRELEVLAIATNYELNRRYIMKITGGTVTFLPDSGMWGPLTLTGVWFEAGKRYYISGLPVFFKIDLSHPKWHGYDFSSGTSTYKYIRGNKFNDLVIASWLNEIAHFNGYNWKSYSQETGLNNAHWYSVDMRGDMIVAGGDYGTGLVAIGRRE